MYDKLTTLSFSFLLSFLDKIGVKLLFLRKKAPNIIFTK